MARRRFEWLLFLLKSARSKNRSSKKGHPSHWPFIQEYSIYIFEINIVIQLGPGISNEKKNRDFRGSEIADTQ